MQGTTGEHVRVAVRLQCKRPSARTEGTVVRMVAVVATAAAFCFPYALGDLRPDAHGIRILMCGVVMVRRMCVDAGQYRTTTVSNFLSQNPAIRHSIITKYLMLRCGLCTVPAGSPPPA